MAQYFPNKKFVDVGLLDNGISIPLNFENHNVEFPEDSHAIIKAISGFSTKDEENRGYGLPSSFRIITNGYKGEFYIFSRNGAVLSNSEGEKNRYKLGPLTLNGTLVYMRFEVPSEPINIHSYL